MGKNASKEDTPNEESAIVTPDKDLAGVSPKMRRPKRKRRHRERRRDKKIEGDPTLGDLVGSRLVGPEETSLEDKLKIAKDVSRMVSKALTNMTPKDTTGDVENTDTQETGENVTNDESDTNVVVYYNGDIGTTDGYPVDYTNDEMCNDCGIDTDTDDDEMCNDCGIDTYGCNNGDIDTDDGYPFEEIDTDEDNGGSTDGWNFDDTDVDYNGDDTDVSLSDVEGMVSRVISNMDAETAMSDHEYIGDSGYPSETPEQYSWTLMDDEDGDTVDSDMDTGTYECWSDSGSSLDRNESDDGYADLVYDWQYRLKHEITRLVSSGPSLDSYRKIIWIYDEEGDTGKTLFAKHMFSTRAVDNTLVCDLYDDAISNANIFHGAIVNGWCGDIFICDLSRDLEDSRSIYTSIKAARDGMCTTETGHICMWRSRQVVCFANFKPKVHLISRDQWDVRRLERGADDILTMIPQL